MPSYNYDGFAEELAGTPEPVIVLGVGRAGDHVLYGREHLPAGVQIATGNEGMVYRFPLEDDKGRADSQLHSIAAEVIKAKGRTDYGAALTAQETADLERIVRAAYP